jgi:hypothetical protein
MNKITKTILMLTICGLGFIGLYKVMRTSAGQGENSGSIDVNKDNAVKASSPVQVQGGNPVVEKRQLPDGKTEYWVRLDSKEPAVTQIPPPPEPKPIQMREYKPQGTKYECRLQSTVKGRAQKNAFKCIEGEADFACTSDLKWESEILYNDGNQQKEKRTIHRSRVVNQVYVRKAGLTDLGVEVFAQASEAIVSVCGGSPGAGYPAAKTAGEILKSDSLLKIPVLGSWLKNRAEGMVKDDEAMKIASAAQQMLGKIEGHEIICTWEAGKMVEARGIGFDLTEEDRRILNRMSNAADYNIFPDTTMAIGQERTIKAETIAEYMLGLTDPADKGDSDGYLKLVRDNDQVLGTVAVINGAGNCKYTGNKYSGTAIIQELKSLINYGGDVEKGKNVFMKSCILSGAAHITRMDADFMLANIKTEGDPRLYIKYECILKK